jgi:hypothetical protein
VQLWTFQILVSECCNPDTDSDLPFSYELYRDDLIAVSSWGMTAMKKVLFGAIAAIAMITSANAADIVPAPAPQVYAKSPVVAPVAIWNGFYIGAVGGWAKENRRR